MPRYLKGLAILMATLLFVACNQGADEGTDGSETAVTLSAATLGEQMVLPVSEYLAMEQFSTANRKNGSRQAQICRACHSFDEGGANMIGPALFDFFGRGVGEQTGFEYSPVMRNADFVWTPRALNAWLAQPGQFLPGNRMTIAGITRQGDRDDLIAFLLAETTKSESE